MIKNEKADRKPRGKDNRDGNTFLSYGVYMRYKPLAVILMASGRFYVKSLDKKRIKFTAIAIGYDYLNYMTPYISKEQDTDALRENHIYHAE